MKEQNEGGHDVVSSLLAQFRPTQDEVAALAEAESAGDPERFLKELERIDRKYKHRSLERVTGLEGKINSRAFRKRRREPSPMRDHAFAERPPIGSLLADLVNQGGLACDCLVPFTWTGMTAIGAMSGPNRNDVARGMLGARRDFIDEYLVNNLGNTTGKARIPMWGQLNLAFEATLPQAGRWCLLMPTGTLWVQGHSLVVGQGNSTTSYDAKVWFYYTQVLQVGSAIVEISGDEIHYDGTRSEVRGRDFAADLGWPPRYVFVNAGAGARLVLQAIIGISAEANEDGQAAGTVEFFGLPANTRSDYDTFVIKA